MTVIAQNKKTGRYFVCCKGSPERIYELLADDEKQKAQRSVDSLAEKGLRVLLFVGYDLDDDEDEDNGESWERLEKKLSLYRNDNDPISVRNALEIKDGDRWKMIGCTGTEDKLLDHLPRTIRKIQEAAIKTIVCTGDIKLTALNIGINANILPPSNVFDISAIEEEEIELQLKATVSCDVEKGAIIVKDTLNKILSQQDLKKLFSNVSDQCKGVVVYRADPTTKAKLTLFLKSTGLVTCCVGDGANDIFMLEEADVGLGIKSGENRHAAEASDIAINNVNSIPTLILHYGAKNWIRNVLLTHLIISMKIMIISSLWLYDSFSGFNGRSLFTGDMLLAFNMFYGWGVLAFGMLHQKTSNQQDCDDPKSFKARSNSHSMSLTVSSLWWFTGFLESALNLIFSSVIVYTFGFLNTEISFLGNQVSSYQFFVFVSTMIWLNIKISLEESLSSFHSGSTLELVNGYKINSSVIIHVVVFLTVAVFCWGTLLRKFSSLPSNFFLALILEIIIMISIYVLVIQKYIKLKTSGNSKRT
jgi:phospholipid-translocating ATPase